MPGLDGRFTQGEIARGWYIDQADPRNQQRSTYVVGQGNVPVTDMSMGTYRTPIPKEFAQTETVAAPNSTLSPYAGQTTAGTTAQANPNGGISGQLADLLKQQNMTAPQTNQFAGQMQTYLNTAAPTAPTATNQFSGALNTYLSSNAPIASKATMGANRFSAGLTAAEQRLQDLINNPSALQDSASYKFRVNQGQEALQRSLGARGLLNSGNRLKELTKYGQDMGSQEYEAENARRMAMYNAASGNYNTDQTNNINMYGLDQGALDRQYATAADLYKARGTNLSNLYGNEANSQNQRYQTAADIWGKQGTTLSNLYNNENQANTSRYATDVGANINRANTLADLYKTDTAANSAWNTNQLGWAENERMKTSPQPYWVGTVDRYGNPIAR